MKKAMKLVWMVLFALPLFTMTACGDDDDEPAPFKEYGYLIDKTRQQVVKDLPFNVDEQDDEGIYYYINRDNVSALGVFFSFGDYGDKDELIQFDKCVLVSEMVVNVTYQNVYNHLESQYGKATLHNLYGDNGEIDETYFQFEKGGKYIWLYEDCMISYVKKSEYDKAQNENRSRGGNDLARSIRDMARARR